jgi:hypothetical protein
VTTDRSIRTLVVAGLFALAAFTALSFAGSAGATTKCGERVLADWYDNGRIDKLYPLNCYEDAIDAIPDDIGPYVDAADVITRALQGALHSNLVKGGCDPSADGSPDDCTNGQGGGNGNGSNGGNGGSGSGDSTDGGQQAASDVDTSAPSSVPIPLIVLGGLSLLLLAAGALGYLSRRRQAAHGDDVGGDGPLA